MAFLSQRIDAITTLQTAGDTDCNTDAYSLTESIAERYTDAGP